VEADMTDAREKNESGKRPNKSGGVFSKNSKKSFFGAAISLRRF
jgi:hypothetical protein